MPEALPSIETLQDEAELFVFRTVREGEPVLVARPDGVDVEASIARFENALGLRGQLDPAWAVSALQPLLRLSAGWRFHCMRSEDCEVNHK